MAKTVNIELREIVVKDANDSPDLFGRLPNELLLHIFSQMTPAGLRTMANCGNRRLRHLALIYHATIAEAIDRTWNQWFVPGIMEYVQAVPVPQRVAFTFLNSNSNQTHLLSHFVMLDQHQNLRLFTQTVWNVYLPLLSFYNNSQPPENAGPRLAALTALAKRPFSGALIDQFIEITARLLDFALAVCLPLEGWLNQLREDLPHFVLPEYPLINDPIDYVKDAGAERMTRTYLLKDVRPFIFDKSVGHAKTFPVAQHLRLQFARRCVLRTIVPRMTSIKLCCEDVEFMMKTILPRFTDLTTLCVTDVSYRDLRRLLVYVSYYGRGIKTLCVQGAETVRPDEWTSAETVPLVQTDLTKVVLEKCSFLTNNELMKVISKMPSLVNVQLLYNDRLTRNGIENAVARLSNQLSVYVVDGYEVITDAHREQYALDAKLYRDCNLFGFMFWMCALTFVAMGNFLYAVRPHP